jgi:predicted RNA polymerase sigma factor
MDPRSAAEQAARESYGRLVACLAAKWRDLAAVEDALGEAFRSALETWPAAGVPDRPEAWLMTAAHRRLIDSARRRSVRDALEKDLIMLTGPSPDPFPDERLKLLLICSHPAIDPAIRTPLMLQTVLGLDAAAIARAFLVSPAAMGQRLARAKAKIRDAGIPFEPPEPSELPARLHSVLEAIYAAYTAGWDAPEESGSGELAQEAIFLAELLARLAPQEPEVRGLLALMLYCESRAAARRTVAGTYVPLDEQDCERWDRRLIGRAESILWEASQEKRPGPFQLEAAVQSVHAGRAFGHAVDWQAIVNLYRQVIAISPTIGARLAHAAAISESGDAEAALRLIDELQAKHHQPYWAARAHVLAKLNRLEECREAYQQAIGLTSDPAVRSFLLARVSALSPR